MKKRLLSLLCVLALCLSLLPATALAEDTLIATVETNSGTTSYYVGTGTDRQNNVYCETEVEAFQAAWAACGGQTATLTLKQSVELSAPLNSISSSSTQLTLCMEDGVTLTFAASDSNARISWEGGSLTFKSGTIQLNASAGSNSCAAIDCSGGTFALSGGTISCTVNSSSDSVYGVRVRSNGSFNMTGGSIVTNEQEGDVDGVYITSGGEAEISGGTISGEGRGVYVSGSNSSVTISDRPPSAPAAPSPRCIFSSQPPLRLPAGPSREAAAPTACGFLAVELPTSGEMQKLSVKAAVQIIPQLVSIKPKAAVPSPSAAMRRSATAAADMVFMSALAVVPSISEIM